MLNKVVCDSASFLCHCSILTSTPVCHIVLYMGVRHYKKGGTNILCALFLMLYLSITLQTSERGKVDMQGTDNSMFPNCWCWCQQNTLSCTVPKCVQVRERRERETRSDRVILANSDTRCPHWAPKQVQMVHHSAHIQQLQE